MQRLAGTDRENTDRENNMLQEQHDSPNSDAAPGRVVWLSALLSTSSRCDGSLYPDLERALVSPAAVFAEPDEVVRHPLLSHACKREVLWRWAWDEHLIDVAQAEGMPEGPPSRLEEVRTALQRLGEEWRPPPAAPALRLPAIVPELIPEAA
jgi:hypothetical protein